MIGSTGLLEVGGDRLEYRHAGPQPDDAPTLVLLHEGLGSAGMWGELPKLLAASTGLGVFAYSRRGYGASSSRALPWPWSYMHEEALEVLPRVLAAIGFQSGLLVGASDGSSIATIYAGGIDDSRVRGLSLIAPHFFVEEETAAGARAAKAAFEGGDLRPKLARWHGDVEVAFYGWNQAWTDPAFKAAWDITDHLGRIKVPMQILQGERDDYGTIEQLRTAERLSQGPVEATMMAGLGHSIFRDDPDATAKAIADFARRTLG